MSDDTLDRSLEGDVVGAKQLKALADLSSSSGSAEDAPLSDSELFASDAAGLDPV